MTFLGISLSNCTVTTLTNVKEGQPSGQTAFWIVLNRSIAIWSNEVFLPVYLVLVGPHFEYWLQFCSLQFKRAVKVLESGQRRATKLVLRAGMHVLRGEAKDTWVVWFGEKEAERLPQCSLQFTKEGKQRLRCWSLFLHS